MPLEYSFEFIKSEMMPYLKKIGYNPNNVTFVDIDGFHNINMTKRDHPEKTCLVEAMDNLRVPKRQTMN